jgi:hypothetical protein
MAAIIASWQGSMDTVRSPLGEKPEHMIRLASFRLPSLVSSGSAGELSSCSCDDLAGADEALDPLMTGSFGVVRGSGGVFQAQGRVDIDVEGLEGRDDLVLEDLQDAGPPDVAHGVL